METIRNLPNILTAVELAEYLGVSSSTAYALMRDPDFPTIRIGSRYLVAEDKLLQWLEDKAKKVI